VRVVILGATGFIGRALVYALHGRGDDLLILSRRPNLVTRRFGTQIRAVQWTPEYDPAWGREIEGYDAVINLAGEPLFSRRWNTRQKDLILNSRADSAAGIIKAIRRIDHRPDTLISASAVGYYGPQGDQELTEDSPPGEDFLAKVCRAWEEEVEDDDTQSVRTVRIRIGMVLGRGGGALGRMIKPFKFGLGGPLGSGKQWVSWIHLRDLVDLIRWALDNPKVEGPLNGTSPHPITNKEFAQTLGRALHRPAAFPVPGFLLRLAVGGAAEVLLEGQRVVPARVLESGFSFTYPTLSAAFQEIFRPE
jgi:uncharacterized protein (TIGR01777 family)